MPRLWLLAVLFALFGGLAPSAIAGPDEALALGAELKDPDLDVACEVDGLDPRDGSVGPWIAGVDGSEAMRLGGRGARIVGLAGPRDCAGSPTAP